MQWASRSAVAARPPPVRTYRSVEPAKGLPGPAQRSRGGNHPMQRVFLLAVAGIAALAVALPATVGAATFKGVVIAKKQARHTLVTASPNGAVRTTRLHGSLARFRVGRVVGIQAPSLPDGTFAASKVRLLGSASAARFRGAVVAASAKTLTLSAGLSVITLALRSGNASSLKAGDSLAVGASLRGGALKTSMDKIR